MESNSSNDSDVWRAMSCCALCAKSIDVCDEPLLLPCCHSACKACVADEQARINESINKEQSFVVCKICSHEFCPSECVENLFHMNHMQNEKIKSTDKSGKLCQSCEGENKLAFIKCDKCDWICNECFDAHKKLKVFKDHILDDSTKIEETFETNKSYISVCSIHNKPKKMYCESCKSTYCRRCILKDHNLHIYEDSEVYAKQFSKDIPILLTQIIEKRSLIETALKDLGQIESDITVQKELAIENVKTINKKLEEKLTDMAKTLLEQVNSVCHKKEADYQEKKCQLIKLNDSFLHVEKFIDIILKQDVPIAIVMAKDLLKKQLLYLLNKPCTQPNFVKPFTIDVIDEISNDSMDFSCDKMVEGVFKLCFKIKTSDDPINSNDDIISTSNTYNDTDDVEIISADTIVPTITNANTIRGNSEMNYPHNTSQNMHNNNYAHNFPQNANFAHRLHSQIPTQPQTQMRDNSRLHSYGGSTITTQLNSLNHLSHMTNNVPQIANNIPQTGISQANSTLCTMNTVNTLSYCAVPQYRPQNNVTYAPTMVNQQQPQNTPYSRPQTYNIAMQPNLMNRLSTPQVVEQPLQQPMQTMAPYVPNVLITPGNVMSTSGYSSVNVSHTSAPQPYRPIQPAVYATINTNNTLLKQQLNTQPNSTNRVDPRRAPNVSLLLTRQPIQPQQTQPIYQTAVPVPVTVTQTQVTNTNIGLQNVKVTQNNSQQQSTPTSINKTVATVTIPNSSINNQKPLNKEHVTDTNNKTKDTVIETPKTDSKADTESSVTPLPSIVNTDTESAPSMPTLANIISTETPKAAKSNEISSNVAVNVTATDNSIDSSVQSVREKDSNDGKDENKENKEHCSSARPTALIARIAPIPVEIDESSETEIDSDEEACSLCHDYGELIVCESCPRAFHINCHIPLVPEMMSTPFLCTFCSVKGPQISSSDDKHDQKQKIFERILIDLYCHKKSYLFQQPLSNSLIGNNTQKIDTPMDLSIIKKKLEECRYTTEKQFILDVKLMFDNFNKLITYDDEKKNNCKQLELHFKRLLEKFLPNFVDLFRHRDCARQSSVSEAKRARFS